MKKKLLLNVLQIYLLVLFISCNNNQLPNSLSREKKINVNFSEQGSEKDSFYFKQLSWLADTTHSSITFRCRHSGVYDVVGWIDSYEIKIQGKRKDFTDVEVSAKADIRTVKMPNMGMAGNVQGIFDTKNHPIVYFTSKRIENIKSNTFDLVGEMKIKGISKEIVLNVQFNGFGAPMTFGLPGFTVDGKFNQHDFHLNKPAIEESNNEPPLIADSIYFTSNLRFFIN